MSTSRERTPRLVESTQALHLRDSPRDQFLYLRFCHLLQSSSVSTTSSISNSSSSTNELSNLDIKMIADSIENEKSPPQEWIENGDTSKTVSKEEETMGHDILDITTTSPYKEFNFWGTYLGLCLGSACSFGGLLMTGTSLALINAAVGMFSRGAL